MFVDYGKKGKIYTLIVLLLIAESTFALEIGEYEKLKQTNRKILEYYIAGVGSGFFWSNTMLEQKGRDMHYCQPGELTLNFNNYASILDNQISKISILEIPKDIEPTVEFLLYKGLVELFPCPS